jgi:hypothetical protein
MIVVIAVAMGVLLVGLLAGLTLLVVILRLAPKPVQQRVSVAAARWNELMFEFLGRASYAFAVVMVVTIGLGLIGAVALLFAPR